MLNPEVGGFTATVALDFLVVSATLVADTVTLVPALTFGAVNMPPLETVPAEADQVTAVLLVPWTVAENCWVFPDVRVVFVGETVTLIVEAAGLTATVALAFFEVFALLVAVTVTLVAALTVGAANKPLLEIVPADADQVTPVLVVPCTVAVNCLVFPDVRDVLVGETVTVMGEAAGLTATFALALFVVSAALVAVTVTFVLLLTVGAVKRPLLETVPPVELQVTALLVEPLTAALNC
jgi:hypothetical protein